MLISTGRVKSSEPWRILEIAIGQAPDVMALRISKELKCLHEPAEALIPFTPNASGIAEWVVEHVYVRGLNGSLSRIAAVPGIDFMRKEFAPPDWIAQLKATQPVYQISQHSFVRILSGPCARMCGHVTKIHAGGIEVTITLPTKKVLVHTHASNLQPVDCPPELQSFFS